MMDVIMLAALACCVGAAILFTGWCRKQTDGSE